MTRFDVARTQQPKSTAAYGSLRFGPLRYQLKRTIGMLPTPDNSECSRHCLRARGQGLISPSTADFMMANHLPGDIASLGPASFAEQPMDGVGFSLAGAVVLDPARSRVPGSVGDFSWGGMASTFFWIDRIHDFSVVMFTQLSPSSSYPARAELKALVHGALT